VEPIFFFLLQYALVGSWFYTEQVPIHDGKVVFLAFMASLFSP